MAITQAICTSFKVELATGLHDFTLTTGNVFKLALYTSSANLDASTTVYSATNEASGTNYTAGGAALTNVTPVVSGTTVIIDFDDLTYTNVTITARAGLIYNSTNGDRAVAVLDFGADQTAVAQNLTIQFPPAVSTAAIIRLV